MRTARAASFAPRTLAPQQAAVMPRWIARTESWALALLAAILTGVSGGVLWALGLNYDGITGSAFSKIHPATYFAIALIGWRLASAGNPVIPVTRALTLRPACVSIALCGLLLLALIAVRGGTGLAGSIDTHVLAGLLPILLLDRDAVTLRRVEIVFHVGMFANAVLGLVEFASQYRFFPFRFDGMAFDTDTRSAALQGHPLANATITCCYIMALSAGGGRMPPPLRAALIGLQLVALVTFGGRAATVTTLVVGGLVGFVALARIIRSGRVPLLGAACACFVLTAVPAVIAGLSAVGFFDTLLKRFVTDGGSANARVEMLTIFEAIPFRELLIGPNLAQIATLRRMYGLEWGIENPIVSNLLYNGILVTTLLVLALTFYLAELARLCRRGVGLPILTFVILINTFESLAPKTTMLAKFAMMLIVLFPLVSAPSVDPYIRKSRFAR